MLLCVHRDKARGKPDYTSVPSVVFSSPQLAYVGKHEAAAVKEYGDVDVYTSTSTWAPSPLQAAVGFPQPVTTGKNGLPAIGWLVHCTLFA